MKRYNYYELIKEIENVALQHPLVNSFYTDRYTVNDGDVYYPAFIVTNDSISVGESTTIYNMNFLYVDRLSESESNLVQIQSVGVDIISEIANVIRECLDMNISTDMNLNVFRNQFADNVAGAVMNSVPITLASNTGRCDWFNFKQRCNG